MTTPYRRDAKFFQQQIKADRNALEAYKILGMPENELHSFRVRIQQWTKLQEEFRRRNAIHFIPSRRMMKHQQEYKSIEMEQAIEIKQAALAAPYVRATTNTNVRHILPTSYQHLEPSPSQTEANLPPTTAASDNDITHVSLEHFIDLDFLQSETNSDEDLPAGGPSALTRVVKASVTGFCHARCQSIVQTAYFRSSPEGRICNACYLRTHRLKQRQKEAESDRLRGGSIGF